MRIGRACPSVPLLSEAAGCLADIAALQPGCFINFTIVVTAFVFVFVIAVVVVAIVAQSFFWYLLSGVFVNNVKSPADDIDNNAVMADSDGDSFDVDVGGDAF